MKYMYWGFGLIMFGLFGLVFIVMFESITINNESEYYVLKEAMEAAMLESVDLACYRLGNEDGYVDLNNNDIFDDDVNGDGQVNFKDKSCGDSDLKIVEQKFVENFTRRFAASITGDVIKYELKFYDIIESPPKATVVVKSKTKEYSIFGAENSDFTITNDLSGILELYNDELTS